jgi:phosphatidylglycerophosphate synthase
LAHSSVFADVHVIVDASHTHSSAVSVQRLHSQLTDIGVQHVSIVTDTRAVAAALRADAGKGAVLIAGDIVLHRAALRTALVGSTSRALISRREMAGAYAARVDRDRVVSAGSSYHAVTAPNGALLDVIGVSPGNCVPLADSLDTWSAAHPGDAAVTAVAAVALVRGQGGVRAVDIRELLWRRATDDDAAHAAVRELDAADEETLAMHSAVKAEDEAFTTFFVSPYSRYVARACARLGIAPNTVTLASIVLGFAAAAGFAFGTRAGLIAGAVLLQVSFMLDCVDGQLARLTSRFSAFGAWLDITFDRAKEYAVYAGLAVGAGRAGLGNLWPWALAALVIRVSRHLVDFSFAVRPATGVHGAARDLDLRDDGLPAADAGGAVARTSRRMDASAVLRWARKIAVLPFGQRLALVSITAAVADARVTFYALVPWAGAAGLYATTGRVLRSLSR